MPFVSAGGVQVNFPFEPYECQITYMEKVITCLRKGENGILESPTGTGKTLCLLCGTLAWLEDKKAQISSQRWRLAQEDPGNVLAAAKDELANQLDSAAGTWAGEMAPPKIIYASRTHTQLTQAIQELKRTAYRHFRVCVLGSREQLCINPQVMKEENNSAKVHLCRAKVSSRTCHFYNNLDNQKHQFSNQVMDIEDLVRAGQKFNCCPYYAARELKAEADIVFMPYNYLLDPKSRRAHGVELQGNIVIFDEAHNLERMCEEATSFELSSVDLAGAMRELNDLSEKVVDMARQDDARVDMNDSQAVIAEDFTLKDILQLKAVLHSLEAELDNINLAGKEGVTKPGRFMFEILGRVNLSFDSKTAVIDVLDKIVGYLTNENSSSVFSSKGAALSKFADALKIVFSREPLDYVAIGSHQDALSCHYKVHIREVKVDPKKRKKGSWDTVAQSSKPGRVMSYWCFSPGHAMEDLRSRGVRSIILTSGTLSPLDSFKSEMGIDFHVELENPHVIEPHQVWIGTLGKGPDGTLLNSSYQNRSKPEYQASLGNAIVNFARVVPNGLLLFFPSYPVMEKCLENWQSGNIWSRIEQYKPVFVEPRNKHEFNTAMTSFYSKINDPTLNGAIFAAVCRGKVSEGLDFSDINGRAVVITGLPFPPRMDPRVVLKMEYLNDMRRLRKKGLTGDQWYRQQASRAVNQAIGRVIRHRQDYGAIILCDNRFSSAESLSQLPCWLRQQHQTCSKFGLGIRDVMMFFKKAEKELPQPVQKGSKSRVNAELGCQGAHFQPTLRNNMPSAAAKRSSDVEAHVPSLKPIKDESPSLAQLQIQYENSNSKDTSRKASGRGLLSALTSSEGGSKPMYGLATAGPSSADGQMGAPSASQASKKRKILIKSRQPASADVTKDSLQSAELYLAEVKQTLSSENYAYFARTLAKYKKEGEFVPMVSCLADIFTQDAQRHHLFRRFYRFVRSKHKAQFEQMCQEIIGQSCGNSTKKRPREDGQDETMDKKLKTGSLDTKSESVATSSAYLDHTTHLSSGSHLNQQTHLNPAAVSSKNTVQKSESTVAPSTDGKDPGCERAGSNPPLQDRANLPTTTSTITSTSACDNPSTVTKEPEASSSTSSLGSQDLFPTPQQDMPPAQIMPPYAGHCQDPSQMPFFAEVLRRRSGYPCCACKQSALVPLKAPCEHIACMECWKEAIKATRKCPACGLRVKRKHLERLYFKAGC